MLSLIAKNIFMKIDISKLKLSEMIEGKPFPLSEFKILDVGCGYGK
jgi:2-polyprenyl-3-methyl-5-hydroxy-6-metoxy-1,4-benzoquinol methylase